MKSCSFCINCEEYDERCKVHNMPLPRDEDERERFAKECSEYEDVDTIEKIRERINSQLTRIKAKNICSVERPMRKTFCQLAKGHKGSHRAVVFWEE